MDIKDLVLRLKVIDQTKGVFKKVEQDANRLNKNIGSLSDKYSKLGDKMGRASSAMRNTSLAAAGALTLSFKAATDFESSFAGVRKTVDATEEEFADLEERIRKMSKTIPTSTSQLNKIGEMAGQLGVAGVDNLEKFIATVADIAVTTNLTEETAATSFARISNIMGEPISNIDRMASSVVDLGNNFATTELEITEFATRISGAGKIAGLTTADIFAIGAAMSSVGVAAEAGGTSVQKVLNNMTEAVATGNENLQVFAETAGVTAEEFKRVYEQDAGKAFTMFVKGIGEQGDSAFATLENLGLSNERVIRAFLSLGNAGDLLERSMVKSSDAFEANTALSEEAEKRYKTTASQLKIAKNNFNDLAITIGRDLIPQVLPFVEKMVELIKRFKETSPATKKVVTGLLAFTALASPLLKVGSVLFKVGALLLKFGSFIKIGQLFVIASKAVIAVLALLSIKIIAIIAVIAALAFGVYKLITNWSAVTGFFANLWQKVKELFVNFLTWLGEFLTGLWATAQELFKTGVDLVISEFKRIPERIGFMLGVLVGLIVNSFVMIFKFWTEIVPKTIMFVINWFSKLPEHIGNFMKNIWHTVSEWFVNTKNRMIELSTQAVIGTVDWFKKLPERIAEAVSRMWTKAKEGFNQFKDNAKQWAKDVADSVIEYFKNLPERVKNAISGVKDSAISATKGVFNKFTSGFKSGFEKVTNFSTGGIVGGVGGKDNNLAAVTRGEMILNNRQQQNLFDLINGGSGQGGGGINITQHNTFMRDTDPLASARELAFELGRR